MGQLRFLDDGGQFNTLELLEEKLTIGRDESCGLRIQGDLISREHAQFPLGATARRVCCGAG